ncbi:aminopeptidase P family N-terminal domain-containing protein [Clostridium sp. OS1-26]|nr:aminopeptidase P family N-terminal domain-containing protein [Clostridium sp. OS1-26]WML35640.1 aminopeptidase P family N-terminal domain-containing protein [Clostridium sp. OS1-26]
MERLNRTQAILKDNEWDALFLVKRANVNYISRFSDEAAYALIGTDQQFLITDGRFLNLRKKNVKGFE